MDGLVWVNKHQQTCVVASRVAASIPLQNGHFSGSMSNLGSVSPHEGLVELSFAFCFRIDSVSPLVDIALSSCPQVFDRPGQPCHLSSSSSSWKSRPSCNPSRLHPEIWSSSRPTQPMLKFFHLRITSILPVLPPFSSISISNKSISKPFHWYYPTIRYHQTGNSPSSPVETQFDRYFQQTLRVLCEPFSFRLGPQTCKTDSKDSAELGNSEVLRIMGHGIWPNGIKNSRR